MSNPNPFETLAKKWPVLLRCAKLLPEFIEMALKVRKQLAVVEKARA